MCPFLPYKTALTNGLQAQVRFGFGGCGWQGCEQCRARGCIIYSAIDSFLATQ